MGRRKRYAIWISSSLLVLAVVGVWYCFFDRAVMELDRDEWHLRFSHIRVACHVCTGKVEQLTWGGQSVLLPQRRQPDAHYLMLCSVGTFNALSGEPQWRMLHAMELAARESSETISEDENAQGYYDYASMPEASGQGPNSPYLRKRGTPAGWALILGNKISRWVQPTRVHELEW